MASENVYALSEPSHTVTVELFADTGQTAAPGPAFTTSILFSPDEARTVGVAMIDLARRAERRS